MTGRYWGERENDFDAWDSINSQSSQVYVAAHVDIMPPLRLLKLKLVTPIKTNKKAKLKELDGLPMPRNLTERF